VRRAPGGGPQLVLLDHGLYRRIDDAFRRQYAALWRALILADREGIRMHATALNAGEAYPLFAAMLTMRPWDQVRAAV
jgi:aarF domain-containing kinase